MARPTRPTSPSPRHTSPSPRHTVQNKKQAEHHGDGDDCQEVGGGRAKVNRKFRKVSHLLLDDNRRTRRSPGAGPGSAGSARAGSAGARSCTGGSSTAGSCRIRRLLHGARDRRACCRGTLLLLWSVEESDCIHTCSYDAMPRASRKEEMAAASLELRRPSVPLTHLGILRAQPLFVRRASVSGGAPWHHGHLLSGAAAHASGPGYRCCCGHHHLLLAPRPYCRRVAAGAAPDAYGVGAGVAARRGAGQACSSSRKARCTMR